MLNQTLKNIRSFFVSGKRIFHNPDMQEQTAGPKNTDNTSIRRLYHRELTSIQAIESKPEALQHDWWIN